MQAVTTTHIPQSSIPTTEFSQVIETFSTFFQKAVSSHPKKPQILSQLHSFLTFLSNNRDDLSKGYVYLKEMKTQQTIPQDVQKIEIVLHYLKVADSQYQAMNEITEFDILQEMKPFNCDPKFFSYDLLLLCVSVRFWDVLLTYIDQNQLNLMLTIKEKVFHDTLSQSVQEKIISFFQKIEELAKTEQISYKKALAKVLTYDKPTEYLITMIPVIKQIIIKFLINSEWNFVREKLQDKLNTNSLNQIFTLFKNQINFPQKEPELQSLEENTQNFLQILALGLNINIQIFWSNSSLEGEGMLATKSFSAKNKEEALGTISVFVIKQQNIWLYYNLHKNDNWGLDDNNNSDNDKKLVDSEKFETAKHFNNFFKSTSIKITEDMFPLNIANKQFLEEPNLNNQKKKSNGYNAIKPNYLIDFLTCFQDKTEEIYGKVFMSENGNNDTKKISLNRYLSTELDQKTEIDEIGFSLNEKKNSEIASAGMNSQNNLKKMGFIQKCIKCPKEYVEYEVKNDSTYLCYICR